MRIRPEEEITGQVFAELLGRTGCNDIREGGQIAQLAPAFARRLFRAQFDIVAARNSMSWKVARGTDLDHVGSLLLPDGELRTQGRRAVGGRFVFTANPVLAAPLLIPRGTKVSRSRDGFTFTTLSDITLLAGVSNSPAVSVLAPRAGAVGNSIAGEIDEVASSITGVTSGTNTSSIGNGMDREEDDDYRNRFPLKVKSHGSTTGAAAIRAALAFEDETYGGVSSAAVSYPTEETPGVATLYIDNGTGDCDSPATIAAGEVLLAEAAGGETDLFLSNRPIVTPPVLYTMVGGVSTAIPYLLFRSWGLCRLYSALTTGLESHAGEYTAYAGLVKLIQDLVNGQIAETWDEQLDGHTAGGTILNVKPASKYGGADLTVDVSVIFNPLVNATVEKARLASRVTNFINARGVAGPGFRAAVSALLMKESTVRNITSVKFNGVDADVYPAAGQVIRTADASVTLR